MFKSENYVLDLVKRTINPINDKLNGKAIGNIFREALNNAASKNIEIPEKDFILDSSVINNFDLKSLEDDFKIRNTEISYFILFDAENEILDKIRVTTNSETSIEKKSFELLRLIDFKKTKKVIHVHNHPNEYQLHFSLGDEMMYSKFSLAFSQFNIEILDFIIYFDGKLGSFKKVLEHTSKRYNLIPLSYNFKTELMLSLMNPYLDTTIVHESLGINVLDFSSEQITNMIKASVIGYEYLSEQQKTDVVEFIEKLLIKLKED